MSFECAKKIVDEVASPDFRKDHKVWKFEVGENGDASLNPDFLKILRYLRKGIPDVKVSLFTNFSSLDIGLSAPIVKENLVDYLCTNIDGSDGLSYYRVKGLPLSVLEGNLLGFLDLRAKNQSRIGLKIQALTLANYVQRVYHRFSALPVAVDRDILPKGLVDDFELIKLKWERRLNPQLDHFERSVVFAWAERETVKKLGHNQSSFSCSMIHRVENEAFISTNGDWYACCYDEQQLQVFGNIVTNSIEEVYRGVNRERFLQLLRERRFKEIGYPCSLVESCQWL